MSDVTQILRQIEDGDDQAAEKLLPLVYDELRKLAAVKMAQEKPGQTLDRTALVHEAYIRLVDVAETRHWDSRGHFFSAAAIAMRRILVEQARRKRRQKRGGEWHRISLRQIELPCGLPVDDLLALDEAIEKLEHESAEKAKVVQLRFFVGMNHEEIAKALGVSVVTVGRNWRYARAWLRRELHGGAEGDESEDFH
ncbi:ECF-type sigma factor [Novipirellula artificiosorum]|uniref:RNA polymerase sigma factor SigY n=1 Tax=Novipirellula artificiosorum TaxID=2528016 RepID=A0A5C6DRL5_9BACT|nr:ECF-type sigma factor [Novipirellula artificiosorum]TWU39302.1 RNA polymerase sigma factor SigY [Novipirellula artificiosorum]